MTIKRRLFFSNILMNVLPIILTIIMGISITLVFVISTTNTKQISFGENKIVYVPKDDASELLEKYDYTKLPDEIAIYKSDSHGYLVVFPYNTNLPNSFSMRNGYIIPFFTILLLVIIVYLTNRVLTRLIFKSIMLPINTLVNGVHEIRDGNLNYRIDYKNKDEFATICSDFNEMAARLLDMVNQRQKDEQNRRELIAGVSHDLRTPLTSIKSYVKGLKDGIAKNPEKEKEYLDITYRKTCEMEVLIDQLFLFSKLETDNFPFHFKSLSIQNYIITVLDSMEYELRDSRATMSLESNCTNQKVMLDGEQMNRVISNILSNSIKHNQNRDIHIDISLHQKDNCIIMQFQDNGQGVSEQQLTRLFDIFYRGDESRSNPSKGNGLGLSIAKKIVTAHGGKITAKNSNGLCITIELPMESEEKI